MRRRGKVAVVLAAVLAVGSYPVQTAQARADDFWYDGKAPDFYELDLSHTDEFGYIASDRISHVPAVSKGLPGLLRAASVPRAYMNDIEALTAAYPDTKSQKYNDCWAFSAVGLAEFDLITDDKAADKSVDFSELQMAYFTYNHAEDPLEGTYGDKTEISGGNYLNFGGNLDFAARSLMQWKGLVNESKFPYTDAAGTRSIADRYAYEDITAHLQNAYLIDVHKNAAEVKQAIMEHGSVGTGYYAAVTPEERNMYEGSGMYNGVSVDTYYCDDAQAVANHAVNIVGWDDDFPAENFAARPKGNGAWLIRNSWGETTEFDLTSYFWLSYYDVTADDAVWVFDFEPADNYDYNYQYDGCATVGDGYRFDTVANVFTVKAEANEELNAVSFSMLDHANVPYTIKVYTNLASATKPRSGYLAATVKGTTGYAGVYTVPLKKAVSLAKGTKFSVVVETSGGRGVDVEFGYRYSGRGLSYRTTAYIEPGQSFVFYNGEWEDMEDLSTASYGTGNVCIKAYTSSLPGGSVAQVKTVKKQSAAKTAITLKWSKVSGASGYEIYRASTKNGVYKKVKTITSGTKTTYKDTGLTKNKTYYYRVRAYKNNEVQVDSTQTGESGELETVTTTKNTTTVGKMSARTAIKTAK